MTAGFLSAIVKDVRAELEGPGYGSGLPKSRETPTSSLRRAIERDRATGALVVEYKRVSPGQEEARLPPRSIPEFLEATEPARPTAFSCLATAPRFDGSPLDVHALSRATGRPVLFKEFVIDRRQVEIAERAGASAILLIARLEKAGVLRQPLAVLAKEAHRRGLEVLLEFHERSELSHAVEVAADVFGVNARDLDSLRLEPGVAESTIEAALAQGLRPLLGLSGVATVADAHRFWNAGVDGILVGTAVARARDPARFVGSLRRRDGGATE